MRQGPSVQLVQLGKRGQQGVLVLREQLGQLVLPVLGVQLVLPVKLGLRGLMELGELPVQLGLMGQ